MRDLRVGLLCGKAYSRWWFPNTILPPRPHPRNYLITFLLTRPAYPYYIYSSVNYFWG